MMLTGGDDSISPLGWWIENDGSTSIATIAVGGDRGDPGERVAVWAFATEGEVEARTARAEDGTEERLESWPMPG